MTKKLKQKSPYGNLDYDRTAITNSWKRINCTTNVGHFPFE